MCECVDTKKAEKTLKSGNKVHGLWTVPRDPSNKQNNFYNTLNVNAVNEACYVVLLLLLNEYE